MQGEVVRVLAAANEADRRHYATTLFSQAEARAVAGIIDGLSESNDAAAGSFTTLADIDDAMRQAEKSLKEALPQLVRSRFVRYLNRARELLIDFEASQGVRIAAAQLFGRQSEFFETDLEIVAKLLATAEAGHAMIEIMVRHATAHVADMIDSKSVAEIPPFWP